MNPVVQLQGFTPANSKAVTSVKAGYHKNRSKSSAGKAKQALKNAA